MDELSSFFHIPLDVGNDAVLELGGEAQLGKDVFVPLVALGQEVLGKRVEGMPMLAVQGPAHLLVQVLQPQPVLVGHVPEDGVHGLGLVVPLFALDHVVRADAALGEIDVACVLGGWVGGWVD